MKKLINLLSVALFATLTCSVAACSDDDETKVINNGQSSSELKDDQLAYIQQNIVEVDSLGEFMMHINGIPLTEFNSDTTVVYLGVKDIAEAKETFEEWLPAGISMTKDLTDNSIEASPTDTAGNAQGKVTFASTPSADGTTLATVTFTEGASVPYVSKLVFINENAWPRNATSKYAVGEKATATRGTVVGNGGASFSMYGVCIQEAKNGQSGIVIATKPIGTYKTDFKASKSKATTISNILRQDWDKFANYMAAAGMSQLKNNPNQKFYTKATTGALIWKKYVTINLKTGEFSAVGEYKDLDVLYCGYFD